MTRGGVVALWVVAAAASSLFLAAVWRPFSAPQVHNVVVVTSLLATAVALLGASATVVSARGWLIVGASALLVGFLVRGLPVLQLEHHPLHDGYFYLVSLLNITDAGTLEPAHVDWYSQVAQQLNWPVLQLLSAEISSWSGVPPAHLARLLVPAIGSLTYFAVGLLAFRAFLSWRVAALAGVLGSFGDPVLYYQSEYQPQGLALLSALFFAYLVLASRSAEGPRIRLLMMLAGSAFLFTHHGSTLVLSLMVVPLLIGAPIAMAVASRLPAEADVGRIRTALSAVGQLTEFRSIAVLLIAGTAALHFYYFDAIVRFLLTSLDPSMFFRAGGGQESPALWFSVLRGGKYILLGLAAVGVWRALRTPSRNTLALSLVAIGLFAGTALSLVAFPGGAARFLAFTIPVVSIFAARAIVDVVEGMGTSRLRIGAVLGIAGLYVAAGVANSQSTSLGYLLVDPPLSSGAWFGGAVPRTDLTARAGYWIGKHDRPTEIYAVDLSTRMAPFFFGRVSDTRVILATTARPPDCRANALVVDYELTAQGYMEPRLSFDQELFNRVYDNGSVAIYLRRIAGC
jgi:hypothetical protein